MNNVLLSNTYLWVSLNLKSIELQKYYKNHYIIIIIILNHYK